MIKKYKVATDELIEATQEDWNKLDLLSIILSKKLTLISIICQMDHDDLKKFMDTEVYVTIRKKYKPISINDIDKSSVF